MTVLTAAALKERHRAIREDQPEALRLRIHRALSWLQRAEQAGDDPDLRFILSWVALNAGYAREFGQAERERDRARAFFATIVGLDREGRLHQALFQQFSGPIRTLVGNRFAFEPFWAALRDHDSSGRWEQAFAASQKAALAAVTGRDTATVLSIVFDRLYVLRNQLVHGGATWNSQVNRSQVRDGVAILGTVVPLVLDIMMSNPEQEYGEILYPVV